MRIVYGGPQDQQSINQEAIDLRKGNGGDGGPGGDGGSGGDGCVGFGGAQSDAAPGSPGATGSRGPHGDDGNLTIEQKSQLVTEILAWLGDRLGMLTNSSVEHVMKAERYNHSP